MDDDKIESDPLEPTKTARGSRKASAELRQIPSSIGKYRIIAKLGEGGMGVVYEAEQDSPKRKVAIKVVRGGQFVDEQRVRMFQREADTLARLKHPNIGGIYESGRTEDGQHFFAMELVRGETLGRYIKSQPLPATRKELHHRLQLFRKIGDAAHYAHQRGVIHRDLKPSNIIVTGSTSSSPSLPEIKILDFGLAKITEGDNAGATVTMSRAGDIKGTLAYMSPEQARGEPDEIDVRTDVYALGMILYEMLSGTRPYDVMRKSVAEAVRVICDEPPKSLHQTISGIRRIDADIETIVGKALEKESERRYASAGTLSEDVGRYLASRPILARPPSTSYQLRKFAARNRALVGGIVATFVALAAGAIVAIVFGVQAQMQRKEALKEAETAKQTLDFMTGMFEVSKPSVARGNTITAREILDKGAREIDENLVTQPEIQARLMGTMGNVYRTLGLYEQAEPLLERALASTKHVLGDDHQDTLSSMNNLANLYSDQGRYAEAEALHIEAITMQERVLGDDHRDTLSSMNNLANLYWGQNRDSEAESLYLETIAMQKRVLGDDHQETLMAMSNLAALYNHQGRYDEAESVNLEVRERRRRVLGDDHPDTLATVSNLASLYTNQGRYAEAESLYLEALAVQKRVFGENHPTTLNDMNNLAFLYTRQSRYDEARPLLEHLIAVGEGLGTEFEGFPIYVHSLGELLIATGELEEAEHHLRRALKIYDERGGHDFAGLALYQLAGLSARNDDRDEALDFLRQALDRGYADENMVENSDLASLHGDPEFEAIVADVEKAVGGK